MRGRTSERENEGVTAGRPTEWEPGNKSSLVRPRQSERDNEGWRENYSIGYPSLIFRASQSQHP